jgi:plasmid rolling circle replication initiator protein Rep
MSSDSDGLSSRGTSACFLSDVSPDDKPWDSHKATAGKVKDLYQKGGYERYAERIDSCATWLQFALKVKETGEVNLKLFNTRFCRVRHCQVCQWRRSLMWRARLFKALPKLFEDYPKARFIFLTLTVRNRPLDELRDTINQMNQAWQRLSQRKNFPALGFIKSLEVTREKDNDYAHPHFHCLLMVDSSYFVGRKYLNKDKWIELWRNCLRVDYSPSVKVRAVRPWGGTSKDALFKSICETLKYSVKEADLIADSDWLLELTRQLHKTRAISVGGVLKEYISEDEPEDLIHADLDDEEVSDEDIKLLFDWSQIVKRYAKR